MTLKEFGSNLIGKKVAVLGLGEEGRTLAAFLYSLGISPVLLSEKLTVKDPVFEAFVKKSKLKRIIGNDAFKDLRNFDVIFRSPGISLLRKELKIAKARGVEITSQTKAFFDLCPCPIIGVTGTKGKGTTCTLISKMLDFAVKKAQFNEGELLTKDSKVYLTGNIGEKPPLSFLKKLRPIDIVIFELSSFQLEDLKVSPKIAVVLMVVPAHLDHNDNHKSLDDYINAKSPIVKYQKESDVVIYNPNYALTKKIVDQSKARKIEVHAVKNEEAALKSRSMLIDNFRAAAIASEAVGANEEAIISVAKNYKGLPNRLELVASRKGIDFYNDSLSTIPEASVAAVEQFKEPVVLILGGTSTVKTYEPLASGLNSAKNLKAVVLIGKNAPQIKKDLKKLATFKTPIYEGSKSLKQAFSQIKKIVVKGDVVLLSPASASFDMFKNYKERGKEFTKIANSF